MVCVQKMRYDLFDRSHRLSSAGAQFYAQFPGSFTANLCKMALILLKTRFLPSVFARIPIFYVLFARFATKLGKSVKVDNEFLTTLSDTPRVQNFQCLSLTRKDA